MNFIPQQQSNSDSSDEGDEELMRSFKRYQGSSNETFKEFKRRRKKEMSANNFSDDSSGSDEGDGLISSDNNLRKRKHSGSSSQDDIPEAQKPYVYYERQNESASTAKWPDLQKSKGFSMLEKMGFKSGKGLGKHNQGRVEPVELSQQRGRRGLGLSLPALNISLNENLCLSELPEIEQKFEWLSGQSGSLDLDELRSWVNEGPKDLQIERMTDFCDAEVLKDMLEKKNVLDLLTSDELFRARSKANPFETLKSGMFLNRAALKMANMDAVFDFMFTNPKTEEGEPMVGMDELLYFADVCAGPGGFSEYVLWRRGWRCKGFGFTLKGECDFRLGDFYAGHPETFEPYYGIRDDGNVFDPDNIRSLTEFVMKGTDGKGVHFMMADGGFSVDGQENLQEILSKQLYLCQLLVALSIVRYEGHLVCKLFDVFSPFSAGLVYLMYRAFKSISLFKPNSSRPANSERYIICKHKRADSDPIRDYLFEVNVRLNELKLEDPDSDVTHVVPMNLLTGDELFYDYLFKSNNSLGKSQAKYLRIIAWCVKEPTINLGWCQFTYRIKSLAAWSIPDKPRAYDHSTPREMQETVASDSVPPLFCKPTKLVPCDLSKIFKSVYDWLCMPLGSVDSADPALYLGMGRNKVYRWNPNTDEWTRDLNVMAELNPGTLVVGEVVKELKGEGVAMTKMSALHLIDGYSIGRENISSLEYHERLKKLELYCKALEPVQGDWQFPVRTKVPHDLTDINDIFRSLTYRNSKQIQPILVIENERFSFQPKGVLFLNITRKKWLTFVSSSTGHRYYLNRETGKTDYLSRISDPVHARPDEVMKGLWHWQFEEGVGLHHEPPVEGVLHKDALVEFATKIARGGK